MKASVSKENFTCPRSCWLRRHAIFELCDRISSRKLKSSRNRFRLFIRGPGRIFYANQWSKISFWLFSKLLLFYRRNQPFQCFDKFVVNTLHWKMLKRRGGGGEKCRTIVLIFRESNTGKTIQPWCTQIQIESFIIVSTSIY